MTVFRLSTVLLALLLSAPQAFAQTAGEGEWASYRDAYRAMLWFDKYSKPKHFLQNNLQLMAAEKGVAIDGMRLSLTGKSTQVNLPLDAVGRAVFPMLKSAYDENATLRINGKLSQYKLVPRVSILARADGVYEAADLRAACEQALGVERYLKGPAATAKACVGVRFVFAKKGEALVRLRNAGGDAVLPAAEGAAFDGDMNDGYKTVTYRFAAWPAAGQVVSQNVPLAVAAVFE
jgi:hypothetical protein